jgi:hypothetical protein
LYSWLRPPSRSRRWISPAADRASAFGSGPAPFETRAGLVFAALESLLGNRDDRRRPRATRLVAAEHERRPTGFEPVYEALDEWRSAQPRKAGLLSRRRRRDRHGAE